ncbi:MAG: hypothetical protein NE330_01810 [Lentisphaeraceae bacterium]|nr:hypothetical protein [Lentisphaeraceae bacterium]
MIDILLNIMGWIAMACILLAFYLLCNEKVTAKSKSYQVLNIVGSSFFVVTLSITKAWPAVALNAIYAAIAANALIKIYRSNNKTGQE